MTKSNVPEFSAVIGTRTGVQGAMFPAMIWKSYMDEVHNGLEVLEFNQPPIPTRAPLRLYLPGVECAAKVISGTIPPSTVSETTVKSKGNASTTTTLAPGAETATPNTVVISVLTPFTTISPTDSNPYSPVPTTDLGLYFYECSKPFPNSVQTSIGN